VITGAEMFSADDVEQLVAVTMHGVIRTD
jgi:hypothetical protein